MDDGSLERHQERLGVVRQDGQNGSHEGPGEGAVVPQLSLPPTSSLTVMPCRALRSASSRRAG